MAKRPAKKTTKKKPVKKNPVGRPRALNAEKKAEILRLISIGGSRTMAAKFVGVHVTTLVDEAKRDQEFSDNLTAAEGQSYAMHVGNIARAANQGDVKASMWFLARRYSQEFGDITKHALTNSKGVDLTAEERQKAISAIMEEKYGVIE